MAWRVAWRCSLTRCTGILRRSVSANCESVPAVGVWLGSVIDPFVHVLPIIACASVVKASAQRAAQQHSTNG